MERAKMTQCSKILEYMKTHDGITPKDADREFSCMRLASRISDLKRRGYRISKNMETSKNKAGESVRYARYRLEQDNESGV